MRKLCTPLVAIVLALSSFGCSFFERDPGVIVPPEIQSAWLEVKAVDFEGADLLLNLSVRNPNYMVILSPEFRYQIDIEGSPFVKAEESVYGNLRSRRTSTVTLL